MKGKLKKAGQGIEDEVESLHEIAKDENYIVLKTAILLVFDSSDKNTTENPSLIDVEVGEIEINLT